MMMKKGQQIQLIIALGTLLVGCAVKPTQTTTTNPRNLELAQPVFEEKDMDLSVDPGKDFFRYVNGGWIENTQMPAEKTSYGSFDIVRQATDKKVKKLLDDLAQTVAPQGTMEYKIGTFYSMGMDQATIDKAGIEPIQAELDLIGQAKTITDIQDLIARFHTQGMSPLFSSMVYQDFKDPTAQQFYIFQDGLGMPDRDYYLGEDERSTELRKEYLIHLEKMFTLLGEPQAEAAINAAVVMKIETQLAQKSWTKTELRNLPAMYNKMTPDELQKRVPSIEWKRYFSQIGDITPKEFIVGMPKFMDEVGQMLETVDVKSWQIYLRWCLINSMASHLSDPFVMQDFHFFKTVMAGAEEIEPRWRRVVQTTNNLMGEPVGKLYVETYFPASSKERMVELVDYLRKAFAKRLETNLWMTEETRAKALAKLEKMRAFIGYPDKWEDFSKLEIEQDSYAQNVLRARRFDYYKNLNKYNEPVDPEEWGMDPHTVNAGYNPLRNVIMFPAGILQPPFFYPNGDDAINYGAIGMAIGHEMTHGFDDMGRNFDKDGNMQDWWTEQDTKKFEALTQKLIDQYNGFSVLGKTHVNGKLSLGENIADFGGLTITLDAYRMSQQGYENPSLEGFTPEQRLFLSYARVWRGLIRDEALLQQTKEDPHPWGEFRVNGAPFNIPEFYEIFEIDSDAPLYRTSEQRPVIW